MLRGKDGRNRLPLVGKLHLSACYRAPVCESAEKTVWMLNSPHFPGIFPWRRPVSHPGPDFRLESRDFRPRPAIASSSDPWPAPAIHLPPSPLPRRNH